MTATVLDTVDPLSAQALELTVTDPLSAGAAVTTATVTVTVRTLDETALTGLTNVAMPHVASGLYRVIVPASLWASAGVTLATGSLLLDYTATLTGTSPLVSTVTRQRVTVARTVDT